LDSYWKIVGDLEAQLVDPLVLPPCRRLGESLEVEKRMKRARLMMTSKLDGASLSTWKLAIAREE